MPTKLLFAYLLFFLPIFKAGAQTDTSANAIVGKYQNENGGRKMEIYLDNGQYFGKITATTNEDNIKVGTLVLKNFKFGKSQWVGTAYAPRFNKDLDAVITMPNNHTIEITVMGRTKVWTRTKQ